MFHKQYYNTPLDQQPLVIKFSSQDGSVRGELRRTQDEHFPFWLEFHQERTTYDTVSKYRSMRMAEFFIRSRAGDDVIMEAV